MHKMNHKFTVQFSFYFFLLTLAITAHNGVPKVLKSNLVGYSTAFCFKMLSMSKPSSVTESKLTEM